MYEENLKRIICLHPELIEEGFIVEHEEYPIRSGNSTYRCDLKGKDSRQQNIFVEIKITAHKDVLYQIAKYKTFLNEKGRYIVVALEFDIGIKEVLNSMGFETVEIYSDKIEDLLERERNNPELYKRKTSISGNIKMHVSRQKSLYAEKEREIVDSLMKSFKQVFISNAGLAPCFSIEDLDIRKQDEYRLLFKSSIYSQDRLVIYNRYRRSKEIQYIYVPDFSFETGNCTERKKRFKEFILYEKDKLEQVFGMKLYDVKKSSHILHGLGEDHLEITSQAWKGFSQVFYRDLEVWQHPDFLEMMVRNFIDYTEKLVPLLDDFHNYMASNRL